MNDDLAWQERIRELYTNIEELYSHIDVSVIIFDRDLAPASATTDAANTFGSALTTIARRTLETGQAQRDVALDQTGRLRAHALPLRDDAAVLGVVCVVDDDGARRELFVRCAMAIFDGYRRNEAALLERERRALAEAQRANELRDRFMAIVAHELRAPIASILLWEQVLRNDSFPSETHDAALDAIQASANAQALLVADLLDVSRAITGKLHLDRRATPLAAVLAMAVNTARPRAAELGLALETFIDTELGTVIGDARRLRQIIDNLIANALTCTEHGGVTVTATQTADTITVEVSDTGRGIRADALPHLFEPFWQADSTGATLGLGLGLGIARQLVELHGGTLTASSDGAGRGARFTVTFPLATTASSEIAAAAAKDIGGARVLVVDDDVRLLEALALLLERCGAIVTTATSAAEAFQLVLLGQTDVMLSDIGLSGEDGNSLVSRIRSTCGTQPPAIALTARTSDESRQLALSVGFDRFLTKPVDLDFLVATIADMLRR